MRGANEVFADIDRLIGAWCDRRCFRALRAVLLAWPLCSGLTDAWGALFDALEKVRALALPELAGDELSRVDHLIRDVDNIVRQRLGS